MQNPKGGDQPAYHPPAGNPQYGNPPAEQPPTYQKPPTDPPPYETPPTDPPPYEEPPETPPVDQPPNGNTCEPPTGDCKCKEWPIDNCPSDAEPCRRLLEKLETILEGFAQTPTDATKSFADDLKDADKEYQGVNAAVKKYKEFYDKLDCKLAEAANWKKDLDDWVAGKISDAEKTAIEDSRKSNYTDKEKKICCDWLQCRDYYNTMLDCLEQSKKKEDEAKDNYEGIKGLEKTLSDRFAELKALYDKAKGFRDEERYRAVYAVTLEYNNVYEHLSELRDWDYARNECSISGGDSSNTSPAEPLTGDLKKDWTPEKFKTELLRRLRLLVLAKYQRFRWQHDFLSRSAENQKKKDACEKFRKERRDKFIQEADDITPPDGGGGNGGYGQKPPTGDYPDEQPPENPPTTPYQGEPDPGYPPGEPPPTTPPPTQQYPTGNQPKYPEPPAPPDKYRGRQKS
jgi:hypothetical protein